MPGDNTRFFGDTGFVKCVSGTPAPDGDYYGLVVYDDITITSADFVDGYSTAAGILAAVVLPKGSYPMRLKNLVVSAGGCFVYKN